MVRARYDASITDEDNYKHWAWADYFSAKAANMVQVRRVLRMRARYERANNSYCAGMVRTLADATIGTGPRLHVNIPDEATSQKITEAFREWSKAIRLGEKLHTMRQSLAVDGEAFGMLVQNPELETPAQLDIKVIECDQICTPYAFPIDPLATDGMKFDIYDNPIEYHLLKNHPGDLIQWGYPFDFDVIPARYMLHWYRNDRPHQYRGVPEFTPALPLFAQLRRYTLAVIAAAETAADFAAVLQSELPPDQDDAVDTEPYEHIPIEKRSMTTLPAGWKLGQLKAEHPSTTYDMFKREILNEIARCLNMPYNIAAGNSSSYNYSSGRLDHQIFFKSIGIDQNRVEFFLDRVFSAWIEEMRLASDLIPASVRVFPRKWFWDGQGHIDPVKDAVAEQTRLASNTTTLAEICARSGHDWRAQLEQTARERELMAQLGIPVPQPAASAAATSLSDFEARLSELEGLSLSGAKPTNGHSNGATRWTH